MYILAPSILTADFANLESEIKKLEAAGVKFLHIDVMDGAFVPNITIGAPVVKSIRKVTDMVLDVHLMINKPERYIEDFAKAGSDYITVHAEATEDIVSVIKKIKALGIKPAVSVKPNTPIDTIYSYLDLLDMVLIMSVEPGFGGQSFITSAYDKVRELRREINARGLKTLIEIDGGVNLDNIKSVVDSGVDVVVVGSAIFNGVNPTEMAKKFIESA